MWPFTRTKKTSAEDKELEKIIEEIDAINSKIQAELYAEFVVVEFIAKEFAKCKINFYKGYKLNDGEEYYRWNIKPNSYQNGVEFKKEFISKLLTNNEVLVFENRKHDLIIADSFSVKKNGTSEYLFSDVCKEDERNLGVFKSSEVVYLSYEENEIKSKLRYLLSGLQQVLTDAANIHSESAFQKGILQIDTLQAGDKDLEDRINDMLNKHFKTFFSSKRNAVLPLFKGLNYRDLNDDRSSVKRSEVSDIKTTIDEMISKAAIAHGIMPSIILGDRENTTEAEKTTISNAIKPIADLIETGITASLFGKEYLNGNYAKVDIMPIRYATIFDYAEASDKLLASGQFSIDEIREARGERRLNTWWSTRHLLTKNYQFIEQIDKNQSGEGGENSGEH